MQHVKLKLFSIFEAEVLCCDTLEPAACYAAAWKILHCPHRRYYKRRLLRIVPAYYAILIFLHLIVLPMSSHLVREEAW